MAELLNVVIDSGYRGCLGVCPALNTHHGHPAPVVHSVPARHLRSIIRIEECQAKSGIAQPPSRYLFGENEGNKWEV